MWLFPSLRPVAALLLFCCLPCLAEAPKEFTVFDSGAARELRLVGPDKVVDTAQPDEPLAVRPLVTVPVPRRAQVPDVARRYGALRWQDAAAGGYYVFHYDTVAEALAAAAKMYLDGLEASPVVLRQRRPRFTPADPLSRSQWHLRNTGQNGGVAGIDLNVYPAWQTSTGNGVNIAIVDDGLEITHPDFQGGLLPSLHRDFNSLDNNPSPSSRDPHGTAVAGLAAARANLIGGVGVAPGAKLAGLRLTAGAVSDADEADAFGWKNGDIDIYNNSWGPADTGWIVEGPGSQAAARLRNAALFGRGGRGNIFVWAGGNGTSYDDANYDGYANSIYTIAVGAVSDRGVLTTECEAGANLLVTVPSSSRRRQGLITTDLAGARGYNANGSNDGFVMPLRNLRDLDYTNDFGMTSGATPQVSGVVALMLEANPLLGWRDVQEILIRTARKVDAKNTNWETNGAGFSFNERYGAGLVDASAAVELAKTWQNLPGKQAPLSVRKTVNLRIPDNSPSGVSVDFDLSALKNLRVEHVQFRVSVDHPWRGDLRYELKSPAGTTSVVDVRRDDKGQRLRDWAFMSVQNWGESSRGVWTLKVADRLRRDSGLLRSVELIVHGTLVTQTGKKKS